jgi:hypothetical protein
MKNRYGSSLPARQILRVGDGSSQSLRITAWSAERRRIEA